MNEEENKAKQYNQQKERHGVSQVFFFLNKAFQGQALFKITFDKRILLTFILNSLKNICKNNSGIYFKFKKYNKY